MLATGRRHSSTTLSYPHAPWDRRNVSAHLYEEGYRGKFEHRAEGSLWEADPRELARLRALYDGEIFFADLAFGRILDHLEETRLLDNTVVVFTSDHGEEFMEHGRLQHGWLTEENIRIPLLIRHPDTIGGRRIHSRVTNLDLLPTLMDIAGLEGSGDLDGRSVLAGSDDDRPLLAVAHTSRTSQAASIREGSWKLIVRCGIVSDRFLYDLELDPGETRNLAAEATALADEMESHLWRELELEGCSELPISTTGAAETRPLDPRTLEALKRLGYLDE